MQMVERSSLSFCPMSKGSVWNVTKELKQSELIYLKTSLAEMEMYPDCYLGKDGDVFFFSSSLNVSES